MRSSFAALILAGGRSRRMGRDKAWLRRSPDGPTQLERLLEITAALDGPTIVSARSGQPLPPFGRPERNLRVDDPEDAAIAGPLLGIHAGLLELRRHRVEWVAIVSVDELRLSAKTLLRRRQLARAAKPEAWALLGEDDEGVPQPLSAFVRADAGLQRARACLDTGCVAPRRWLQGNGVERYALDDWGATQDADTPEQWARHSARPG